MDFNFRRNIIFVLLFFVGATFFSSCKKQQQNMEENRSVLYRGNGDEPSTLDPHLATGTWENNIIGDLFVGLITETADGSLTGGAAEKWQISDNGKIYTFYLRKDALWSDGKPVTADDFVFSFRRILSPAFAARYANILYLIENARSINTGELKDFDKLGVKAVDDYTLQIRLETPAAYFISLLTNFASFPVPRHVVEKFGKNWSNAPSMVSNGPYKLAEWKSQQYVKLIKNDFFYDSDNVKLKEVYFYPTSDTAAALKRFRNGELDINIDFPMEQYEWLQENMPKETLVSPQQGIYYYAINQRLKKFQDIRVRKALALSLDINTLVSKVIQGGVIAAYNFVPPFADYQPAQVPFKNMPMSQRLDSAKKLLQEAGYSREKPLTLVIQYNTSENHKKIAIAVASMWKQIGVQCSIVNAEAAVHFSDMAMGKFEIGRLGWIAEYADAQAVLRLLQPGKLNYGAYQNAAYDKKMQQASETIDPKKRALLLREAEQMALNDFAVLPIYFYVSKNLVSQKVKGWQSNSRDVHRSRWLYK